MKNDKFIRTSLEILTVGVVAGGLALSSGKSFDVENPNGRGNCSAVIPRHMNPNDVRITTADMECDRVRITGEDGEDFGFVVPRKSEGQATQNYCAPDMLRDKYGDCYIIPPQP